MHQTFIGKFVFDKSKLKHEVPKVIFYQKVKNLLIAKSGVLTILFANEAIAYLFALFEVVELYQKTLPLDLLDRDKDVVALIELHALCMNDVLVISLFLVETELELFQICEVIECEEQCSRFGGLLNCQSHGDFFSDLLDSSKDMLEALI